MSRLCIAAALLLLPTQALSGPAGPADDAPAEDPAPARGPAAAPPRVEARRPSARPARAPRRIKNRAKAPARRRAARVRPRRSAAYAKALARWRERPEGVTVAWEHGYRDLVLYSVNWRERATVRPFGVDGSVDRDALRAIRHLFRERRTGAEIDVDERLVRLLYRIADHFDAPQVTVISGYRSPRRGRHGHHTDGTAVDFLVPGVPDSDVAAFARTFGGVGVGLYTTSGFVHLDVRDRGYFWTDASGPGQRARPVGRVLDLERRDDHESSDRDVLLSPEDEEPTSGDEETGDRPAGGSSPD